MYRFATPVAVAALLLVVAPAGNAQAQTAPAGSYQQSCSNLSVRGNRLFATCTNTAGRSVRTSINFSRCVNADIANVNGRLFCARNGNFYGRGRGRFGRGRMGRYNRRYSAGIPSGSYSLTCSNAALSGSTLTATCRDNSGNMVTSYLDVSQCRSTDDIGNINGQLRCVFRPY